MMSFEDLLSKVPAVRAEILLLIFKNLTLEVIGEEGYTHFQDFRRGHFREDCERRSCHR